jgi:hypothetical protein
MDDEDGDPDIDVNPEYQRGTRLAWHKKDYY